MTLHCQGLRFAFSFSRGLATNCFVGVISLSKNGASNPDVCGSNLYLQRDRREEFRAGLPPTPANTVRTNLDAPRVTEGQFPTYPPPAATARVRFHPQNSIPAPGAHDLPRAGSLWTCPCSAPPSQWGDSAFHTLPAAKITASRREEERREDRTSDSHASSVSGFHRS